MYIPVISSSPGSGSYDSPQTLTSDPEPGGETVNLLRVPRRVAVTNTRFNILGDEFKCNTHTLMALAI